MFRNLMPQLTGCCHVGAPDYAGSGKVSAPPATGAGRWGIGYLSPPGKIRELALV
jgi:hypothetical protein